MPTSRLRTVAVVLGLVATACSERPPTEPSALELRVKPLMTLTGAIVSEWAPVILQDVDQGLFGENADGKGDFVTRFDFDADWNAWNNWTESWPRPLPAYVYTTVVEEANFWFVTYDFYHPRDWCLGKNQLVPSEPPDQCLEFEAYHENDFEGAMFIVHKGPGGYGRGELYGVITHQHTSMNPYLVQPAANRGDISMANGHQSRGFVQFWNHLGVIRPVIQIEPRGHGVFAAPDLWSVTHLDSDDGNFPGDDGVMYWYKGRNGMTGPEVPSGAADFDVAYDLLWLNQPGGLWARRYDTGVGNPFYTLATMNPSLDTYGAEFGAQYTGGVPFYGTHAKPPWAWDVGGDGALRGWFLEDPAAFALEYFNIPELGFYQYVYNPYCTTAHCFPQ